MICIWGNVFDNILQFTWRFFSVCQNSYTIFMIVNRFDYDKKRNTRSSRAGFRLSLVGSEMCIRDSATAMRSNKKSPHEPRNQILRALPWPTESYLRRSLFSTQICFVKPIFAHRMLLRSRWLKSQNSSHANPSSTETLTEGQGSRALRLLRGSWGDFWPLDMRRFAWREGKNEASHMFETPWGVEFGELRRTGSFVAQSCRCWSAVHKRPSRRSLRPLLLPFPAERKRKCLRGMSAYAFLSVIKASYNRKHKEIFLKKIILNRLCAFCRIDVSFSIA